jgi:hypothetical protein
MEGVKEGVVFCFWATFTIDSSLLCVLFAAIICRMLYSLRARQDPTWSTCLPVCMPRVTKFANLRVTTKWIRVGEQTEPEFCSGCGRTEEPIALSNGLSAYRTDTIFYLSVGKKMLWKFCDSEFLDSGPSTLTISKHTLECSSQEQVSMLSCTAVQFTCLRRGGYGFPMIQSIRTQGSWPN